MGRPEDHRIRARGHHERADGIRGWSGRSCSPEHGQRQPLSEFDQASGVGRDC